MIEHKGIVSWTGFNQFRQKRFYSFALEGEDKMYYRTGETDLKLNKGDSISFSYDVVQNGNYTNNEVDVKSVVRTQGVANNVPASKAAAGAKKNLSKDDYWTKKEEADASKQFTISYQAATNTAVAIVSKAVELELLKLPKTANKGFDAFTAAIDKEAIRLFSKYQTVSIDDVNHNKENDNNDDDSTASTGGDSEGRVSDD